MAPTAASKPRESRERDRESDRLARERERESERERDSRSTADGCGVCALHSVSSSRLGPVGPSFRALSGRLKFTVRRHTFNQDSLSASKARESAPRVMQPHSVYTSIDAPSIRCLVCFALRRFQQLTTRPSNRLFQPPWFAPHVAGFRRAPVQIKDLEETIRSHF